MTRPRWKKIFSDLWTNRKRVILAILSIMIGVFAMGTVSHMYIIVTNGMATSYNSADPPDITISTNALFDQRLVDSIARIPEVTAAQGWRSLVYRYKPQGGDAWYPINLHIVEDFNNIQVNKIVSEKEFGPNPTAWPNPAVWPPPTRTVVLERTSLLTASLGLTDSRQNDIITIELPGGKQRQIKMAGLAYDSGRAPATFTLSVQGYIDFKTAEWFGERPGYNELLVRVNAQPRTLENIAQIGNRIRDKVEKSGYEVFAMSASEPGRHPLSSLFDPLAMIMGALGLLTLPLSGFLVINTISAFITQQIRQIGVMKAVGATTWQITVLYLAMVMIFGLVALLIGIPLAALASKRFIDFMAYFINFNLGPFTIPTPVLAIEFTIGLLLPVVAALHPVLKGARTTVREAISSYGVGQPARRDILDILIGRIHFLPRPTLLSLRNTFRRKARLALTLSTLILASAVFIAVLSVRASLFRSLDELIKLWGFDIQMRMAQSYRMDRIQAELSEVPGIKNVEGWGLRGISRILPDGSETTELIILYAVPADSKLIHPSLREGRWLLPEDDNALVVSPSFMKRQKDVQVGSEITLKMSARESTWRIVGVMNMMDSGGQQVFSNYRYYTHLMNEQDRASVVMITVENNSPSGQVQGLKDITEHFNTVGLKSSTGFTLEQQRQQNILLFNILILLLMAMGILLAVVGALGLTGLMSINVIERTREIGVMRAIGASTRSILSIFMTEGMLIGAIAWFVGTLLSIPLSKFMSDSVGTLLLGVPLDYAYSFDGAALWMAIIIFLSALSTYAPARDAARLTVRDVLAYE